MQILERLSSHHHSNWGNRMVMAKWGWQEAQGLGANLQGHTEPYFPAYQRLGKEKCNQSLGEARYKGTGFCTPL